MKRLTLFETAILRRWCGVRGEHRGDTRRASNGPGTGSGIRILMAPGKAWDGADDNNVRISRRSKGMPGNARVERGVERESGGEGFQGWEGDAACTPNAHQNASRSRCACVVVVVVLVLSGSHGTLLKLHLLWATLTLTGPRPNVPVVYILYSAATLFFPSQCERYVAPYGRVLLVARAKSKGLWTVWQ